MAPGASEGDPGRLANKIRVWKNGAEGSAARCCDCEKYREWRTAPSLMGAHRGYFLTTLTAISSSFLGRMT
jgi:hypothetical protein